MRSKHTVTKFPDGTIMITGEPKFIGRFPVRSEPFKLDPEHEEILEELSAVLKAGKGNN